MRFSESDYVTPSQLDFLPRQRRKHVVMSIASFTIAVAVILALIVTPQTIDGKNMGAIAAIVMIGAVSFFTISRKQKNLDLVMSTEYQNMLFAQAAALGSKFCLFARRDGTVVYANDGLRSLFPKFDYTLAMSLEGIFAEAQVSKTDRERLMNALYSDTSESLVFPIRSANGVATDYVLTIEPMPRPGGFAVIRGREYIGARAGVELMPDVLRATSPEKLNHLLTNSAFAQYVTDSFGRLEYVNPALEDLCGYLPGEILTNRLSIHHLFHQMKGTPVPDDYTIAEHHGDAMIRKKQGSLVQVILEQALMRDAEGKITAATGCILPVYHTPSA